MCTSSSRTCLLLVFVPFDRCNAHTRKKNMFINLVNCTSTHSFNIHSQCRRVHSKTTYEWHTDDIRVHTSNIRMIYDYIRVTYERHTSTYDWHTGTCEWHIDDTRLERKIKLTFENLFFGAHFLHGFFIQMLLIQYLSVDRVSMSYLFSFSRYQIKRVIKFLFRQLMTS